MNNSGTEYNGRSSSIEDKPYTKENSTPEEIQSIKDCIYIYEPGIIYWYETPCITEFSIAMMSEKVEEISKGLEKYAFLIDLTRAHRPNAEARMNLKKMFASPKLTFVVVFTEKNMLLNMAAKFVLSSTVGEKKFLVVKKKEEAIEAARKALV